MTLDANRKLKQTLNGILSSYHMVSEESINENSLVRRNIKIITKQLYSYNFVKMGYEIIDANMIEQKYSNGLICLNSKLTYRSRINNDIKKIDYITVLHDYKSEPLINLIDCYEQKSVKEFLVNTNPSSKLFCNDEKILETISTSVYIGKTGGSVFKRYVDLTSNEVLAEKYNQHAPFSSYDERVNCLIRLCGCAARDLEIIYSSNKPVYAQLSGDYSVEMAGFDPTSSEGVEAIIRIIGDEVDLICDSIIDTLDDFVRINYSLQKKKNGNR
jgi:hypothetical protein